MTIPLKFNFLDGLQFYQSLLSAPSLAERTREQIAKSARAPRPIREYRSAPKDTKEVVELLNSVFFRDMAYEDLARWALMRAVGRAEDAIVRSTTSVAFDEERISGQFSAVVMEALAALPAEVQNPEAIPLSFADANVTGQRAERLTGGDIGVIVRTVNSSGRDVFKSAVIQAKKVTKSGIANCHHVTESTGIEQIARLGVTPGLGHYLFYHARNHQGIVLPPTMCSAETVAASGMIARFDTTTAPTVTAAAYIAYMLTGEENAGVGALTFSPDDAAAKVFSGLEEPNAADNRIIVFDTSTTGRMTWEKWRKHLKGAAQEEQSQRAKGGGVTSNSKPGSARRRP